MNKKHVLIVEDDPQIQRALQRVLTNNQVTFATTVAQATTILSSIKFDAIITDYNLADHQTGEDLIRWISENNPEMLPKTIVFSGNHDALSIHTSVIMKPAMGELRTALAHIAD